MPRAGQYSLHGTLPRRSWIALDIGGLDLPCSRGLRANPDVFPKESPTVSELIAR